MTCERDVEALATMIDTFGSLRVHVHPDRARMGAAAAQSVATRLIQLLSEQERVRITFASAPSQTEFLAALVAQPGIDWRRVIAFSLDEYVGIAPDHPSSFGRWLDRNLFDHLPFGQVHYWNPSADPAAEAERYASLLAEGALDLACIGIGENGHLAFNDPHVADFETPHATMIVSLDEVSRQQQVHDGCFPSLDEVPRLAWTMTIPAIMAARSLFVIVPGANKARAVHAALHGPIEPACPASILRRHPDGLLHLDRESFTEGRG